MLITPKWLNLQTSNLTHVFQRTVWTRPQIFPEKGAWPGSRDHRNFWALNANSSKTVKATDFKFDTRVPRDSSDLTPTNYPKRGVFNNLLDGDMHSHERLLVVRVFLSSLFQNTFFDTKHEHLNDDRPIISAWRQKLSPMTPVSGNIRFPGEGRQTTAGLSKPGVVKTSDFLRFWSLYLRYL